MAGPGGDDPLELEDRPRSRGTLVDDLPAVPGRPRGLPPLLLGLAVVLALGALGAALLLLGDRPLAGSAAEAPVGVVVPGVVYVDSTPSGAEVWLEGEHLGETPLVTSRRLWGGQAELVLRKDGYRVWMRRVEVQSGGLRVEARLVRK